MLNRAFRIPEVDVLFKLRLFIQNLHQLIISSSTDSSIKTIYRSQLVTDEELERFKKCTDESLIGFSHFFLASTERPEGKSKDSASTENQTEQNEKHAGEEILFQIDVSNSNEYMLIENDQILVTFGLITRFGSIEKDRNGRTIIHLSTLKKDDRLVERAVESIRKEIRAPHPSLRLVKLFIELNQYTQAVYLGQFLIADSPSTKKDHQLALARTYHSLGTTLYEKEDYDQALEVIKKSHELYVRFLPEDAPQLSPTWNNMGSIYLRQGKTDLALEYHERALAIQLKSPSPDLASIISYSNNIGGVYLKLERYDEALIHFKRALQIEEQTLPAKHPELAGTYHRIGGVYFRQNNHEKALEYYDKTLEIELASLPDNHPTVAVTYHNRGTALEGLGRLQEAVESAEKAVERLLKTLPKEHSQVRMNQAYADRLKQKLWVKQLFNS
jgi:tetratricopeptide (TPR) repeat protein